MSKHYGDFPASHTAVCMVFDSFAASTGGASAATSNFAAADVLIYKDGSNVQRTSANGIVVTTSFDSQVGLQMVTIDLSDNTDAGFYAAGHEYQVAVADITIDSQTVRFWLGTFSIERAGGVLALIKGNAITIATVTNQLTAAQIAAGVWRDTVSGDFTAANSIGKSVMNGVALGTGLTINSLTGYVAPTNLTAAQIATSVWTDTVAGDFTTSSSIGKSVMNGVSLGTGLTVNDLTTKTGFSLSQTFPTNFSSLGITAGGHITTVDTVTTVTNQLTAAAIATGVWTDTTAGDFTTSLSIGKSIMNGVTLGTGLTIAAVSGNVTFGNTSIGTVTNLTNLPSIPANWLTAAGIASGALDAVWSTAARTLTAGTNIQLPSNGLANVTAWTVAITGNITGNLSGAVGSVTGLTASNLDTTVSSRLASSSYTAPPTANQNADALLDRADAIELGLTPRQTMRLSAATDAGKLSGAATATNTIRNAVADSKDRIIATVDADGNRSAITYDLS